MAEKQMIGSEMSIGGGNTEKMDAFQGGTIQAVGDVMDLTRSSTPMGIFGGTPQGELQYVGSDVGKLKRAPHRGYESGTPNNAQEEAPDTKESY